MRKLSVEFPKESQVEYKRKKQKKKLKKKYKENSIRNRK